MSKIKQFFSSYRKGFECAGLIVNHIFIFVVLFITYFTVIGLTSLIGKIAGKHFMPINPPSQQSCWEENQIGKKTGEEMRRQF